MQGNEQTKKFLKISFFDKIKNCIYWNVEKFFTKYFEKKEWFKRNKKIYQVMKDCHVDDWWIGFSDLSDENTVWDWLSRIQNEYLTDVCGMYYTTSTTTELVGAKARRQLNFFIKRKTNFVDTSHDWKNVRVIEEHQVFQKNWKKKLFQIGKYVKNVFSVQPIWRFVHAFTFFGTIMELWIFDRSNSYSSKSFNIHDELEKFIQALVDYILINDDELGLNTFIKHDDDDNFIIIQHDTTGKNIKIQFEQQFMIIHRIIVCRKTTCYRSKNKKKIVKLFWSNDLRLSKAEHFRRTRDRETTNVITFFEHHDITNIEKMRDDLIFFFRFDFETHYLAFSFHFQNLNRKWRFFDFLKRFKVWKFLNLH